MNISVRQLVPGANPSSDIPNSAQGVRQTESTIDESDVRGWYVSFGVSAAKCPWSLPSGRWFRRGADKLQLIRLRDQESERGPSPVMKQASVLESLRS